MAALSSTDIRRVFDVRFGSKADIRSTKRLVRFTPKSGHWFGDKRTAQPFWRRLPAGYVLPFAACLSMRYVPPVRQDQLVPAMVALRRQGAPTACMVYQQM
jgi:hypothetical protein